MGTALFVGNLPDATVIPAISDFTSKTLNVKVKPNKSFLSKLLGKESPSTEVLRLIDRWKNGQKTLAI
jgi:hypothetical protein